MVETRPIPNILEIIQERHLNFIPDDWGLTLFLSQANKHLVTANMFKRPTQIFILPNEFSIDDYNVLLTSISFWDKLPYEKVLVFQTDSELLKNGIENYLQYDFIGAQDNRIGCEGMMNGGLSIRDVKKCMEIVEKFPYDPQRNEDWYFCLFMKEVGGILPPAILPNPFSMELEFKLGSIGCHAIDKYLTIDQCEQIRNQYK